MAKKRKSPLSPEILKLKIKGAIYGQLLAEAIILKKNNQTKTLAYGTGSALSLASIYSINESQSLIFPKVTDRMVDWYVAGFMAHNPEEVEAGNLTSRAMRNITTGTPYDRSGISEPTEDTAESLGRMLGVAIYSSTKTIDESIENSHIFSSITNAQINSQICCALFSLIIRNVILQKEEQIFSILEDYYKMKNKKEFSEALVKIKSAQTVIKMTMKDLPSGDVDPVISFWTSWLAFSGNMNSYEKCIKKASEFSHDSTIATGVAGAISGITLGFNDIPRFLLNNLKIPVEVVNCIEMFCTTIISKLT